MSDATLTPRARSAPTAPLQARPLTVLKTRLAAAVLVSAMALGSLGLWTVLPIGWLWLASNLVRSNLFSYMFALIACPISMVQAARGLYHLQRRYQHLRQRAAPGPHPTGWLRSLSDERRSMKTITLLDWLMMLSVLVAIVTALIYYFLLSDPLVVTGPQAPGNEHGLQ